MRRSPVAESIGRASRALLGKLCNIVERLFAGFYASARPGARPGIILFVQTFGDLVNINPHIHVLAADGAFDADGGFTVLPPVPRKVLEPWFRAKVLALLRREGLSARRPLPARGFPPAR